MAGIIKLDRETLPESKLIGKLYHDCDRDAMNTFAERWGEWFRNGWFVLLEQLVGRPVTDYVGAMRMNDGMFEYWIGILADPAADVPETFDYVTIPGGAYGVAWVKGKDDPSLYAMCETAVDAFVKEGWTPDNKWFLERYNCPRFTTHDANGEVILDVLASLAD